MNIIFEDDSIIVCEKPAGIATQSGKVTEKDMVSELSNYLKGNVYLIHRLDKPVRGLLVFAKSKAAAAALNRQLTTDSFKKKYYALVENKPETDCGILENYMYQDKKLNKAVIVDERDVDKLIKEGVPVKSAKLKYELVTYGEDTLLDITLITGRFHQIRCQLSNIGCPITGDALYGSTTRMKSRKAIGLTAYSLEFDHPTTGKHLRFQIEI